MPLGRLLVLALALGASCAIAGGDRALAAEKAPAPAAAKAAPASLITEAEMAEVEQFIDKHGRKAVLDPDTSKDMGLTKGDAPVTADQVALVDKDDPRGHHYLYRLADKTGYLVEREKSDLRALYFVSRDLRVFKGVTVEPGRRKPLTVPAARQQLRDELVIWVGVARREKS